MHDILEKIVAIVGAGYGKALSLSDREIAFFLGVVIGGSLWYIASYIAYLREERKRKRQYLYETALYGEQETGDTGAHDGETGNDASLLRLFPDDPPDKEEMKGKRL